MEDFTLGLTKFMALALGEGNSGLVEWGMHQSLPFIIAHQNEDFRNLTKEMLIKNGFFHTFEATSKQECISIMDDEKENFFTLIAAEMIDEEIKKRLQTESKFLVLTSKNAEASFMATLGVKHFISFPFSSQKLIERMQNSL
jgi:hypothetical protein